MRYLISLLILLNLDTIAHSQVWNKVYNAGLDAGLVSSFFVNDSAIFISGAFDSVSGQLVNHITYFDGSNWKEMNGGISSKANCIFAFEGNIYRQKQCC